MTRQITPNVNGARRAIEAALKMPSLWALREQPALTGTWFGCGAALFALAGQRARTLPIVPALTGKALSPWKKLLLVPR